MPTLIVWGDRDAFLDRSLAEDAAAPCDTVQVSHLTQASHWVQHEEPEAVNRLLADFLHSGLAAEGHGREAAAMERAPAP
ncbi:alpha/beta fold hydrolase [Azospirillum ramasamyi]|uniref:alpha/beta fold hydrolase n=1 Tax=Azospirillum ramasamyi TaxID=682998 RepID=UPI0013A6FACC|nr:hypothetical protein [Azospirillum ramasamyi]